MKKEMLINVLQPEEIRIAILEDAVLEELYVERTSHESYVGNIYKGRIVNIEPSIQAAFVDFGVGRNGFLHVSDVEPAYYRHLEEGRDFGPTRGRDRGRGDRGGRHDRGGRGEHPRRQRDERKPDYREMMDALEEEFEDAPRAEGIPSAAEGTTTPEEVWDTPVADDRTPEDFEEAVPDYVPDEGEEAGHETGLPKQYTEAPEPPPDQEEDEETGVDSKESTLEEKTVEASEPGADDEPRRRRRRRGGRGRSRRERPDPVGPAPSRGEEKPASMADPVEPQEPPQEAPPREWPRLMESAERRTEEGDEPAESVEPKTSSQDFGDDELSFSMAPPPPKPTAFLPERAREVEAAREEFTPVSTSSFEEAALADEEVSPTQLPRADIVEESLEFAPAEGPAYKEDFRDEEFEEFAPRYPRKEGRERRRGGRRDDRRDERRDGRRGGARGGPRGSRPPFGRPKPLIQDIFKRGQEVLVQVIKEGIGTKGPTLSTYISIAGRYLVLMPGLNRIGVSRKITDEESRRRLRDILSGLQPPKGLGFIIRTAGIDRNKKELQRDLAYLARLWQVVVRRIKKGKSPCEIYQESDMITRTIRDIFTSDIETIWVDEENAYEHAKEFLQIVMPRYADRIKYYNSSEPMFHRYGIENEIARIQQRHVPLPNGGSIVIEQTEALVAIDVNSGNFRADNNAEETAYQMNLLAAREIARQLRLRDLGGVIVNDFIDMREEKHRRNVERALREAIRRDRARTKVLRISAFGIIEMTRQRIRPSLKRSVFQDCPHCKGTGQVKTCESMSIDVMRLVQLAAHREIVQRIEVRVQEDVAHYLLNRKRKEVAQLEENGKQIFVRGVVGVSPEYIEFVCFDNNNNEVKFFPYEEPSPRQIRGRR
ncbi:MAG: Rne/Rng family ribonuclease [Gemmataceae bacterium]|nr:Rne/Rng family ribonuclease [Gemmataceae bacterium]MCI0738006.1 Rne/Rng family ribonuclease [Gemmataceae bacterium]